jgi:small-conductance mechanosensitive channel/CRP-like cAMP-binding protein
MLAAAAGTGFWLGLAWLAARFAGLLLARHPKLLTDLVGTALFVAAMILAAQLVFDLPATGLIATSSVLIAVLGFALRNVFGDIFSGIALGIEHPYGLGDWIEATESCAGRVTGISWRATRLVTRDGVTMVVPNSLIASHRIAVYGPDNGGRFRVAMSVPLDAAIPADRARRILLAAAMEAGREVPGFAPDVMLSDLSQGIAHYLVRFHVPDFPQEMRWRDAVARSIQRAIHRAGLAIAPPTRETVFRRAAPVVEDGGRATLLDAIDLFRPFTAAERAALAAAMEQAALPEGSAVVRRGEQGDSLFLLAEGVLEVRIARPDGQEFVADRLYPGAVFGEMSLLTGQPRSASVLAATDVAVFELRKADLDPVLRARPALLEGLTAIMAERQARNLAGPRAADAPSPAAPTREDILARLKAFFGIG